MNTHAVRTRFAPSPTGYIHIGNVRSAIYPYLVAKQNDGTYVLRIEDTDQARYVEGATELIEDTLRWLDLNWDEGPEVGGDYGPYFQTERKSTYLDWAKKLIAEGRAYADDTDSETIDQYRKNARKKKSLSFIETFVQKILPSGAKVYRSVSKPIQNRASGMMKLWAILRRVQRHKMISF